MTIQQIYDLAIEMGIKADPRGPANVKRILNKRREEYKEFLPKKKKLFDGGIRGQKVFPSLNPLIGKRVGDQKSPHIRENGFLLPLGKGEKVNQLSREECVSKVLDTLKTKVSEFHYNNWFKTSLWSYEGENSVKIQVPSKFVRDWISENYLEIIKFEFFKLTGREYEIIFKIAPFTIPASSVVTSSPSETPTPTRASSVAQTSPLNPRYTFSNFVVGSSNQFVNAACQAVAAQPARNYNPLFIYGGVGLGKTHLLHAISHEVLKKNPQGKVRFVTGEVFTNEVINSIRYQKTFELRQKYRVQCDLLLIDDVQFIAGKERTMEEFFHTFNALYEARKQIVMTSDVLPKDMPNMEERLRSRFGWGLMADIQPPELETRAAILKKMGEEEKIHLPDEVCHFIAQHVKTNVRDLEGSLIRIAAMASLSKVPITTELAREVLKKTVSHLSNSLTIETIQQMVANYFQLRVIDLKSPRRHKNLSYPRQIAMYLCKKHVKASYPEIGQKFGGKDHTTVIHAFHKIRDTADSDLALKDNLDHLEKIIHHHP